MIHGPYTASPADRWLAVDPAERRRLTALIARVKAEACQALAELLEQLERGS